MHPLQLNTNKQKKKELKNKENKSVTKKTKKKQTELNFVTLVEGEGVPKCFLPAKERAIEGNLRSRYIQCNVHKV